MVMDTVEGTLNALLDEGAKRLCNAGRYERTDARKDYRAGHYGRKPQTRAGEVQLKMPKLRGLPFETAIIERYLRRVLLKPRRREKRIFAKTRAPKPAALASESSGTASACRFFRPLRRRSTFRCGKRYNFNSEFIQLAHDFFFSSDVSPVIG